MSSSSFPIFEWMVVNEFSALYILGDISTGNNSTIEYFKKSPVYTKISAY